MNESKQESESEKVCKKEKKMLSFSSESKRKSRVHWTEKETLKSKRKYTEKVYICEKIAVLYAEVT